MLNNDQEEDGESNYSPWLEKGQNKLSPFQNFRKRLIINTDSIDSGNLKSLKTNGKYTTYIGLLFRYYLLIYL